LQIAISCLFFDLNDRCEPSPLAQASMARRVARHKRNRPESRWSALPIGRRGLRALAPAPERFAPGAAPRAHSVGTLARLVGKAVLLCALVCAALCGGCTKATTARSQALATVPAAVSRGTESARERTSSVGPMWSAGFATGGFAAWDALDGNASTPALRQRYFSLVPDPAGGPGYVFKATVDQNAVGAREQGQRSLLELLPDSDRPSNELAAGEQGREQWFHGRLYFPKDFVPVKNSDWNWVIEWHNWPDGPCCANVALSATTAQRTFSARARTQR